MYFSLLKTPTRTEATIIRTTMVVRITIPDQDRRPTRHHHRPVDHRRRRNKEYI